MGLSSLVYIVARVLRMIPVAVTNEFMNETDEVHAFTNGLYAAFFPTREWGKEYEKEIHYWRGGFMVGFAVKASFFAGIGYLLGLVAPIAF